MERAPIREPGEQRRYESLPTLALEIYYFFFFLFKWKLFSLTSWHFWGFRRKLIAAAAAAWSAVTKKPNITIKLRVSARGDSGLPGEAVPLAGPCFLLPGVS